MSQNVQLVPHRTIINRSNELQNRVKSALVVNPKRDYKALNGRATWYPYYAGFSPSFARTLIDSLRLQRASRILDPWNGSGTTTFSALSAGHTAFGFDLNPVMVISAKAQMLNPLSRSSLAPLTAEIVKIAEGNSAPDIGRDDPLCHWMTPGSARSFRRIEAAVQHLFLSSSQPFIMLSDSDESNNISDLASFFYVALFRSVRKLLSAFLGSNPTWVKRPASKHTRLRPIFTSIVEVFVNESHAMITTLTNERNKKWPGVAHIATASSEALPIQEKSIDLVLTSPPYCTRIDYAVATSFELAILGYDNGYGFEKLRQGLIGTSVVPNSPPNIRSEWGHTCTRFLKHVAEHQSKASQGYYLKNHLQYFHALYRSIEEISRVLRPNGICTVVVQDSYYKDVHNDLPRIFIEMADTKALNFARRVDFAHNRTMAGINPGIRKYRSLSNATESVLFLKRIGGKL